MTHHFVQSILSIFSANAQAEIAVQQEKYMKNLFPFYGIQSGLRRELQKEILNKNNLPDKKLAKEITLQLWDLPQRELQYFAIDLMAKFQKKWDFSDLNFLEYLITHKSWWDSVDLLASNHLGQYFKSFPQQIYPVTNEWIHSDNLWLQRSSLIFQLKYKENTDEDLLFTYILDLAQHPDFFIKKAIGWSLREYAKTNAIAVQNFVETYHQQLSNLSKREALKNLK